MFYSDLLDKIFAMENLPDALRGYKSRYKKGNLTWMKNAQAICNIINRYTEFVIEPNIVEKRNATLPFTEFARPADDPNQLKLFDVNLIDLK